MINDARKFFYDLHDIKCNQKYDNKLPYSFHLHMVESMVSKFTYLIHSATEAVTIRIAAFGHDSIEDARMSYNDIKNNYGIDIAEVIYLCTENRGRTRAERKSEEWLKELKTNKLAVFVKLCDICANTLYSMSTNSTMFDKYKEEYFRKVRPLLYIDEYKDIFNFLDKVYFMPNNEDLIKEGTVIRIYDEDNSRYPVNVLTKAGTIIQFTRDGRYNRQGPKVLSFKPYDLVNGGFTQERPKPNLKNGDLVYIRYDKSGQWLMRYFSHWNGNRMYVYADQAKSGAEAECKEYSIKNPLE